MRIRRVCQGLALWAMVACSGVASASVRVSVMPFLGPDGERCAKAFAASLAEDLSVVPWRLGRRVEAKTYAALRAWFTAHQHDGVDVWILGTISLGRVIFEIYGAHDGALLGLERFEPDPAAGCYLPPRVLDGVVQAATRATRPRPKAQPMRARKRPR